MAHGTFHVLELAAPLEIVAVRQLDLGGCGLLQLADKAARSRPLTLIITTTRRLPISRLICAGPSLTSIFATLCNGTCTPSGAVTSNWRIACTLPRKASGRRTAALKRRSPSKTSVARLPPMAISIRSWISDTFSP